MMHAMAHLHATLPRPLQWAAAMAACALAGAAAGCAARRGLEPAPATAAAATATASGTSGAAAGRDPAESTGDRVTAGPTAARGRAGSAPAIWRSDAVDRDELHARALEAAGAVALEEILLERALRIELARRSLAVGEDAVAQEQQLATDALSADPRRAAELLEALRSAQGLGRARWRALLWRNAALRALARSQTQVTEREIEMAHDIRHGASRAARILVVADLPAAQEAIRRLDSGEQFAEVAAALSTDGSRDRGGLVDPVSRLDGSWPAPMRQALWSLKPGERSAPVLLDSGYVIIRMERELPGDGKPLSETRAESERTARLAMDRIEMDRIQREMLREIEPTIFDEALLESWTRSRTRRRPAP